MGRISTSGPSLNMHSPRSLPAKLTSRRARTGLSGSPRWIRPATRRSCAAPRRGASPRTRCRRPTPWRWHRGRVGRGPLVHYHRRGGDGRISTSGAITSYPLTTSGDPTYIAGPDGALWFSRNRERGKSQHLHLGSSDGVHDSDAGQRSSRHCRGPGGALSFPQKAGAPGKIGRGTPAGAITEYSLSRPPIIAHRVESPSRTGRCPVGYRVHVKGGGIGRLS